MDCFKIWNLRACLVPVIENSFLKTQSFYLNLVFFQDWESNVFSVFSLFSLFLKTENGLQKHEPNMP